MPFPFKRNSEDAPEGDPAANLADTARLRPHTLTQELLDWLIKALETVIQTNEVQDLAQRRTQQALRDALKYADYLYPHTVEVRRDSRLYELEHRDTGVAHAHQVREEQGLVLGLEGAVQDPREGSAGGEGSVRPRLQEEGEGVA